MNSNDNLNADNFRKWMRNNQDHSDEDGRDMKGAAVQAKFSAKKMMKNMCVENGKPGRVIREFMEDGGTVKSVCGNEYLVEVPSGDFTIDRRFLVT